MTLLKLASCKYVLCAYALLYICVTYNSALARCSELCQSRMIILYLLVPPQLVATLRIHSRRPGGRALPCLLLLRTILDHDWYLQLCRPQRTRRTSLRQHPTPPRQQHYRGSRQQQPVDPAPAASRLLRGT